MRTDLSTRAAAVVAMLGEFAPYAAIELVLPGGSLVALLLWLRRRHKKSSWSRPRQSRALDL
jgi:hypothetical protein